ncbi:MAG: molecular chaperone TorD family protein [Sulfuricurvum sp.]
MQETQARSNIYALTSRVLLQELDLDLLRDIKSDENILEFLPTFREWEELQNPDEKRLLDEIINPDFTNISLLHLIPYETFYTREDQKIETGGANPVTDFYYASNFVVDYEAARIVSSDHIGVELEFMHHLCEAELKAMRDNDSEAVGDIRAMQRDFLQKHLVAWAPIYLLTAKFEARTPLYYDIADLALEFILSDFENLDQK